MDTSDEFGIDLAGFDIRDLVPENIENVQNGSDQQQQQQRQMQRPNNSSIGANQDTQHNVGTGNGFYGLPMPQLPGAMEQLNMLLNMGMSMPNIPQDMQASLSSNATALAVSAETLKEQLAQQIKLQQLQQLQTQLLQQQIQLLTAGAGSLGNKDIQQLLTPASTDIRSAAPSTQVSPNMLPPGMFHPMATPSPHPYQPHASSTRSHHHHHGNGQSHYNPQLTMSAPASLVFNNVGQGNGGSHSPATDFLTPLTSPVFPPVSHAHRPKRTASDVFGEGEGSHPSTNDPFNGSAGSGSNPGDGSKLATSGSRKRIAGPNSMGTLNLNMTTVSPALLSTKHRHTASASLGTGNGALDTPSPVDLSMLPPPTTHYQHSHLSNNANGGDTDMHMPLTVQGAVRRMSLPVSGSLDPSAGHSSLNVPTTSSSAGASSNVSPDLMPATPSLMMNMGNFSLSSGLVPTPAKEGETSSTGTTRAQAQAQLRKARSGLTTRQRGMSLTQPSTNTENEGSSNANVTTSPASKNPRRASTSARGATKPSGATVKVGKSTHKDAEQKRRDSLKTSFDELRFLLPPIPLASSLNGDDSDDPPLPGAMPPRGPARGDGNGPNMGVSKLVLLRCGNEYIRDLGGRVQRRDQEIIRLRKEVAILRNALGLNGATVGGNLMGPNGFAEAWEPTDLEKDLEKEDEWFREERRRAKKKKAEEEDQDCILEE